MTDDLMQVPLRFGRDSRYQIQPLERRLLVDGEPAALGARASDLLLALAAQPATLLTKNQLLDAVWPGVVVEENNLTAQISALRKVLGGDAIVIIPGRGYRFAARLDDVVPKAAEAKLKTNLPQPLPALLGRVDDLAALGALIVRFQHRTSVAIARPSYSPPTAKRPEAIPDQISAWATTTKASSSASQGWVGHEQTTRRAHRA